MYYIVDTTVRPNKVVHVATYPEVVSHLEGMSVRAFKQTRRQRMILLEEVGHGEDDRQSVNFVRAMAEVFNMGIVREGNLMRCDITSSEFFKKEEFGN